MPDIHPLLAQAIDERSSYLLTVYADWLADRGDPLAEGWRMLGESGAWPGDEVGGEACWYRLSAYPPENDWFDGEQLPDDVFDAALAAATEERLDDNWHIFGSIGDALTAAAEAFLAVRGGVTT